MAPRPSDIPTNPNKIYLDAGWVGMGDWLGTGRVAHQKRAFRSFEAARRYARSLELHSFEQWRAFCKGELDGRPPPPSDIPHSPYNVYVGRGWISWGDFLGSGRVAPSRRRYRSFTRARAFARRLGLGSRREWVDYCAHYPDDGSGLPDDIPTNPNLVYRDQGWAGWGDFLGTGNLGPKRVYRSFPRARAFARKLGLDRRQDWQAFARGERPELGPFPADLPAAPEVVYRGGGWQGWSDFLDRGRPGARYRFRSFAEARRYARSLGLGSRDQWWEMCRGERSDLGARPRDIPSNPDIVYRELGWIDWGDFLGSGRRANQSRTFLSFAAARRYARNLGLESTRQWHALCRGRPPPWLRGVRFPDDIPKRPDHHYADAGWRGWPDWLGSTKRAR
jgi:hypothetical protein